MHEQKKAVRVKQAFCSNSESPTEEFLILCTFSNPFSATLSVPNFGIDLGNMIAPQAAEGIP